jgi:hypothetical protein
MGFLPIDLRKLFAFEKHFELKNKLTENGDGWPLLITLCFLTSINASFFLAKLPQSKNAHPSLCFDI